MESYIIYKILNVKLKMMLTKKKYLENAATKILKTYERFDKLKEIAKKDPKKEIKVAKFK